MSTHARHRFEAVMRSREADDFRHCADLLAEVGQNFYARGWTLGTSGNFSMLLSREPLQLAITASGFDKGSLTAEHIVVVDENGESVIGNHRASAEAALHLAIIRTKGAGAVLHTHSVWSTLLSDIHALRDGLSIQGYEMLKGLEGITTHDHEEWIPILENSQDYQALARSIEKTLNQHPRLHAILLRRHGLYTWGSTLEEARRHVEILEFLLEVVGRTATLSANGQMANS